MEICYEHYTTICYEGKGECPICELQRELDIANDEIAELKRTIEELNNE